MCVAEQFPYNHCTFNCTIMQGRDAKCYLRSGKTHPEMQKDDARYLRKVTTVSNR